MADAARDHAEELMDVRHAAALVGRHPETVRRWVWSGRLAAKRQGNRVLVDRTDVEALAGSLRGAVTSLAAWAERARQHRETEANRGSGRSAADLVIEDRALRSRAPGVRAGR